MWLSTSLSQGRYEVMWQKQREVHWIHSIQHEPAKRHSPFIQPCDSLPRLIIHSLLRTDILYNTINSTSLYSSKVRTPSLLPICVFWFFLIYPGLHNKTWNTVLASIYWATDVCVHILRLKNRTNKSSADITKWEMIMIKSGVTHIMLVEFRKPRFPMVVEY